MFSRTHKSASNSSRNVTLKCSVCHSLSTNAVFICDSGHVVCKKCQTGDESTADRRDSGDFSVEGLAPYTYNMKCSHHKFKKNNSESACTQSKDLASGDHDKRDKALKAKHKCKSESKINSRENDIHVDKYSRKGIQMNEDLETILEYKNANFNGSQSSIMSLSSVELGSISNEYEIRHDDDNPKNSKVFPRPVTCPIVNCGKMIAMDSVLLHFYFDHSKVQRVTLTVGTPQQILLKSGTITNVTQCSTMFLLENKTKSKIHIPNKVASNSALNQSTTDCNPLLLMGVRIQDDTKILRSDYDTNTKLIKLRHVSTQTGAIDSKSAKVSKTNDNLSKIPKENEETTSSTQHDTFGNNEILLLWLCKLDGESMTYRIIVESRNKKQGHMYTGEAIHIRDKQDYTTIYEKSECLILRGPAVNKLLDELNQIIIIITILE